MVGDAVRTWDARLPQIEFAHNHAVNRSSRLSSFQVVYRILSRAPVDLSTLPDHTRIHGDASTFVDNILETHAKTTQQLEASTTKYKHAADFHRRRLVFDERDS